MNPYQAGVYGNKKATITVKRERGDERKEKGRQIEIEITDCNDSVIWQHSQQPYGNSEINSKT